MLKSWHLTESGDVEIALERRGQQKVEQWPWEKWRAFNKRMQRVHRDMMADIVDFVGHGNVIEREYLGRVLDGYIDTCHRLLEPVEIPSDFAVLCAQGLTGDLPGRSGPRIPYDGGKNSWIARKHIRREFHELREAFGYTKAVEYLSNDLGISDKTLEKWLQRAPSPNGRNT
jgi:hypothetical protein